MHMIEIQLFAQYIDEMQSDEDWRVDSSFWELLSFKGPCHFVAMVAGECRTYDPW